LPLLNGLKYIEIDILEAPEKEKPVEINKKGSWVAYLREGTSDRKMSRTEYQTFIRNQSEDLDTKVLVDYSIEDLDMHSVAEYRRRVELVKKFEHFKEYSLEDFLRNIGVLATERESKQEGLTIGGLLFFGKPQEINRYFPYVQLDLFDHRTRDREMRWQHRISSISDNIRTL
jgi:ATP-dependent DNA helicase RecG